MEDFILRLVVVAITVVSHHRNVSQPYLCQSTAIFVVTCSWATLRQRPVEVFKAQSNGIQYMMNALTAYMKLRYVTMTAGLLIGLMCELYITVSHSHENLILPQYYPQGLCITGKTSSPRHIILEKWLREHTKIKLNIFRLLVLNQHSLLATGPY